MKREVFDDGARRFLRLQELDAPFHAVELSIGSQLPDGFIIGTLYGPVFSASRETQGCMAVVHARDPSRVEELLWAAMADGGDKVCATCCDRLKEAKRTVTDAGRTVASIELSVGCRSQHR